MEMQMDVDVLKVEELKEKLENFPEDFFVSVQNGRVVVSDKNPNRENVHLRVFEEIL